MNHKLRTLLVMVLAVLMVAGVFAGCTQQQAADPTQAPAETKAPAAEGDGEGEAEGDAPATETKEDMTISIASWKITEGFPDGADDAMKDFFYEKSGIIWDPWDMSSGDYQEKVNVWTAANSLPDICFVAEKGSGRYYQWIEQGVIRPIGTEETLSQYPKVWEVLNYDSLAPYAVDGTYYFFPRITYFDTRLGSNDTGNFSVRADWMEKLGYTQEMVNDPTVYTQMLADMTKKDPDGNGVDDTYGYTCNGNSNYLWIGYKAYGMLEPHWLIDSQGNVFHSMVTQNMYDCISFVRSVYQAGGIDPSFPTMKGTENMDKFCAGKAGILPRQTSGKHFSDLKKSWDLANPDVLFEDVVEILQPPTVTEGVTENWVYMPYNHSWSEMVISPAVDDAKMTRILEWYEYAYTEECAQLILFGFEGQDWEFDENGDIKMLTELKEDGTYKVGYDLYPICMGFQECFVWYTDAYQYINPTYAKATRDMAYANFELVTSTMKAPNIDWNLQTLNTPEKQALSWSTTDLLIQFVLDESGASNEELWAKCLTEWDSQGYTEAATSLTQAYKDTFGDPDPERTHDYMIDARK